MGDRPLDLRRILVVEDEYLLADEVVEEIEREGAVVLGPVPNVERALALLERQALPDAAVLDIKLGTQLAFPLADMLIGHGVPIVFTTGYDLGAVPERFALVPTCEKPISIGQITAALAKLFLEQQSQTKL